MIGKIAKGVVKGAMDLAKSPLGQMALNMVAPGAGTALGAITSAGVGTDTGGGGLLNQFASGQMNA
ncbi:MAG: hypothetical protein AAFZ18_32350 [Myxococcota bacterium]